jgi:hypothetical protein
VPWVGHCGLEEVILFWRGVCKSLVIYVRNLGTVENRIFKSFAGQCTFGWGGGLIIYSAIWNNASLLGKHLVKRAAAWSKGWARMLFVLEDCGLNPGTYKKKKKRNKSPFLSNNVLLGHLPVCGYLRLQTSVVYLAPLKTCSFFIEQLKRSGTSRIEVVLLPSLKSWTQNKHTTSENKQQYIL